MNNIEKWTLALLIMMSFTGISVASLGKAVVTPFHLVMGAFIGYGILVSRKDKNYLFSSLLVLLAYILFVNVIQFPNIRYTSILYTIVFGLELTILYNLMRRCRPKVMILACKIIIYAYLGNLFMGFVFDTVGFRNGTVLKFIRVYYSEGEHGGRPMGFSSEPSYAAFIISVAFLCYSHLRDHILDKEMAKLAIKLFLCIIFSKSAYGFIFIAVILMDWAIYFYKNGDTLLRNLFPFIAAVSIVLMSVVLSNSDNEIVGRLQKFSAALVEPTHSTKKKMEKLQAADGSAFARVGPTYLLFTAGDEYEVNFLVGEGAGAAGIFLAHFLVGILVDEGRTSVDAGIIPSFIFDYGIIGTVLFIIFLINCFYNLSLAYWLMFFLILPNANINTQLIWYCIACFLFVSIIKQTRSKQSISIKQQLAEN